MTDLFALRSGGRMDRQPTASGSEMQQEENSVSRSSEELHSTKSSLDLLKYVLDNIHFFIMEYFIECWSVVTGRLLLNNILTLFVVSIFRAQKN